MYCFSCSKSYQGTFQVFWGVSSSIFMVSIVVYLAELLWVLIHAFRGLERARPWAMGLDTSSNLTNTHKKIHNQMLLSSDGK